MQHLQKTGGWQPGCGARKHSILALSCRFLHQERFTTLLVSNRSALFLQNAGWHPPFPQVSLFMRHFCANDAFANHPFSARWKLFQVPYPVTPLLATLTKTAGCVSKIPILKPIPSCSPPRIRKGCLSTLNFQLSTRYMVIPLINLG